MASLIADPQIQLAFSLFEGKGIFAVLLGSGMSRAAEIPTGWEITVDLIRRIGLAKSVEDQADWAAWYRAQTGEEPNYSALLEDLAASPEERRSILHSYIEPTEDDRVAGRKIPTKAHRAIAEIVRMGYIRVIVTTNFDRLMENALREVGIEPTIITSVDSLRGAEPIVHSACYMLKLHGDYKDARILNTDEELSLYPPEYNQLIDRILDEHGLIICGWSGEWDHALRAAFLRAPGRRYPAFWALRGAAGDGAQELILHRKARAIEISDADSFFASLRDRVQTLEQSQRQNPLSIELLISSAKRFLSKPEYRIQLDELFAQEAERILEHFDRAEFATGGQWSQADFRRRVARHESLCEPLASMAGVIGRWGTDSEFSIIVDVFRSLVAQAGKVGSGLVVYLNLRSYPAVLVFTAYALGLIRSERWQALHSLFSVVVDRVDRDPLRAVETLFLECWKGNEDNVWREIEGLDNHKTPLNEHLLLLLQDWGKRFASLAPNFELMFGWFEILGALAFLESESKESLKTVLEANQSGRNFCWSPLGRVGWHSANARKLVSEIKAPQQKSQLLAAGFAKGDEEFFDLCVANIERLANRMRW